MGLDMYLTKKTYVKNWEKTPESDKHYVSVKGPQAKHIDRKRIRYIEEDLCYWRKANHIHKWFVDNVQGGQDNCEEYHLDISKLKQLRDVCYEVMADGNKSKELLPTTSGFFFGDTDYDDWYFKETTRTYVELNELIKELERYEGRFTLFYSSSW